MLTRDIFWFAAGLMVALAGVLVALPLLRARSAEPASLRRSLALGAAAVAGVAVASLALYAWIGTPAALAPTGRATAGSIEVPDSAAAMPTQGASAPSMEAATARLAARLAAGGGTRDDWRLLAQSYDFLGRAEEAAAARKQADLAPEQGTPGAPIAPAASRIEGVVELGPSLQGRDTTGAVLYIYAKQIGAGGPPLGVLRVAAAKWPVTFVLDDGNAMMPGRNLSSVDKVLLEARISRSGDAIPRSGDLAGTIDSVDPRSGQAVRIVINRVIG